MSAYCNGICIMGWELIEGARGVAYPHPECELHSGYREPERCPEGDDENRQCWLDAGHEDACEFEPYPGAWTPKGDAPAPEPIMWGDPPTEAPF